MNKQHLILELAPIRLSPQSTEADLVRTSDDLQRAFLQQLSGFLGRVLLKRGDGQYLDLVLWDSPAAANAAITAATNSSSCAAYFSCMVMGDDPAEGVEHWSVVRSYGLAIPTSHTSAPVSIAREGSPIVTV